MRGQRWVKHPFNVTTASCPDDVITIKLTETAIKFISGTDQIGSVVRADKLRMSPARYEANQTINASAERSSIFST